MKIKHKLLNDFQYVDNDKKIITFKKGTVLEDCNYRTKTEEILVDKDIIDSNPDYFQYIDWKLDFLGFIKANKIPQPTQIHKKILPFLEQFISDQATKMTIIEKVVDTSLYSIDQIKEKEELLNSKEIELISREKRTKDKEEEVIIRIKRVEKREKDYKDDLKSLDKKEDELREIKNSLTEKYLDLEDKIQEIKRKGRTLDQQILESNQNIDHKYQEIQEKIELDIKELSEKERKLELGLKDVNKNKYILEQRESELLDKIRDLSIKEEETKLYSDELRKLDEEIKDWEGLHWKFKRVRKPPSAEE